LLAVAAKKAMSRSSKARLQFPVGRIAKFLKVEYAERVATSSSRRTQPSRGSPPARASH
jgi:hypothetical protein